MATRVAKALVEYGTPLEISSVSEKLQQVDFISFTSTSDDSPVTVDIFSTTSDTSNFPNEEILLHTFKIPNQSTVIFNKDNFPTGDANSYSFGNHAADNRLYVRNNTTRRLIVHYSVTDVGVSADYTTEQLQDIVGAMVDGGTETNIAVTYDDTAGKLNFVSVDTDTNTQLTQEQVEDYAGSLIENGTKTGITVTYDDNNDAINMVVDHDAATNFVAAEHYRWDNDIQSTATINHLNLSSDTPVETEVLVMNDGDAVWGHGEKIHIQVRNDEGSTISAGQPLYSKGEIGGSNRILVGVCDANDSAKMPCIGIAHSEMNTTSTKDNFAVVSGIYNTNISGFTSLAVGDNLYIQDDGSLSQTKPTGETSLIQNVAIVLRTNGSICQGMLVSAIGRTNDVPNLNSGYVFYGNGSNQAVSTQLSTLLPPDLTVDGAGTVHSNNYTNTIYVDADAVSAVQTADDYLKNDASDTMAGALTLEGSLFLQDDTGSTTTKSKIQNNVTTVNRTITVPDASGVMALTSDLPPATVSTGVIKWLQAKVVLSEAQLNNMHSTPIQLVAHAGTDTIIMVGDALALVDRDGSTAQTAAVDLCIGYDGTTTYYESILYERRFMYNESGDRTWQLKADYSGEVAASLTGAVDKDVTAAFSGAITSGSLDSVTLYLQYYIIDNS